MRTSSDDFFLSITRSPLTGRCRTEAKNDAKHLADIFADPDFSNASLSPAHAPEADANAAVPSENGGRPSIRTLIATPWSYWKNEIEVRRTTRALAEFDDHTLRNLGIPDRSQIEFTVRFCREC